LNTAAAASGHDLAAPKSLRVRVSSLGDAALWLAAFLGGFVIREPAPYELYMAGLLVVWLMFGLKFRAEFGPLIVCMLLYSAGGIASIPLATDVPTAMLYIAVTVFLAATAIFYAAVIAERPDRHRLIVNGYLTSAVLAALFGIIGYFHLLPGFDYFTLYDRARGTFEDPNVFGPFLVLPAVILMQRVLSRPLLGNLVTLLLLAIIVIGIFLSFSRGAWGVLVVASALLYVLQLFTVQETAQRLRLLAIGALGLVAVIALLGIALSIDSVADMFQQRARLVQAYDGARLGRFARYALGFELVMQHPLGIGPLEFNKYFPEDEHNVYLKGFTTYGWLGGVTYVFMVVWTLTAALPMLFRNRSWAPFAQCVFAVLVAHLLLSVVIDTDHWRHIYMMFGITWGLIAANKIEDRRQSVGTNAEPVLRPNWEPVR